MLMKMFISIDGKFGSRTVVCFEKPIFKFLPASSLSQQLDKRET